MRRLGLLALVAVSACTGALDTFDGTATEAPFATTTSPANSEPTEPSTSPVSPATPDGPIGNGARSAVERLVDGALDGELRPELVDAVVRENDTRAAWILADLLRFHQRGPRRDVLVAGFADLTGIEPNSTREVDFVWAFNHLIAWDLPAWDGYADLKARVYERVDPRWRVFFDEDHGVDWRLVTWGGVLADDRPFGDNGPCNCIPALDEPGTTDADGGDWYGDERIVFGLTSNGKTVALPRHQMETHEMVNMTLGGRALGIPYCTLCGSAQAYYTDNIAGFDRLVLRTSGLLSRSNKLMYDLTTHSAIDTFTGQALTGPLAEADVVLDQVSVVASTWGDWKQAHPGTLVLAQDGGIGRTYQEDPLRGRDDNGPIFPVGDVDPRLAVQETVVGVIAPDGRPIAIPVDVAMDSIPANGEIRFRDILVRNVDGMRVYDTKGNELPTHQAFWFAWSQFHPRTLLWSPTSEP